MTSSKRSKLSSRREADVPARYRSLPTSEIAGVLGLQPGMCVAELSAGRGDLIVPVSEAVGSAGRAFAVESAPEMLASLRERARGSGNIHVVEAPSHATPIATGCCDRVYMVNLWSELPDPAAALREAARLLRPDGRLILIDWHAEVECPHAPASRIGFREMIRLLEHNTWDVHRHGDVGPHSYFVEASISDESVQS